MSDTNTTDDVKSDENVDDGQDTMLYPSSFVRMPVWLVSVCAVLAVLAFLLAILSGIFVFMYRKKPIVTMSQPIFLFDVIGGSAFIALSILFYIPILVYNNASDDMTQPPTSNIVFCNLMTWTLYLGFIYLFTALLCNIYRIKLITDNPLRRGLKILPKHVAGPYFVITTLAFGLLAAWTAIDPTKYELIELGDDPDKVVGSCTLFTLHYYYSANKSFNKWNIIFVSALEALILIVSIILAILSYKIRHVNPELGDSKRIFRLTLYCFINDIVLITITGTSRVWKMDEATKFVFVNTVFILKFILDSVAIIGFIILPRIYYIWYEHKHGHLPERVQMIGRGRVEVHS